jgi:hypothetical protein
MNMTEAWEVVIRAAEIAQTLVERGDLDDEACGIANLSRAITKVKPRAGRMRSRVDFARARKAGPLNRPKWATP